MVTNELIIVFGTSIERIIAYMTVIKKSKKYYYGNKSEKCCDDRK